MLVLSQAGALTMAGPDFEQDRTRKGCGADLTAAERVLLRKLPILAPLDDRMFDQLVAASQVWELPRRTLLFNQGDIVLRFYVVLRGWVRLFRLTRDGDEVTIALVARGESLAEAAILLNGRFPVNGVAAEDTRLLEIPAASFMRQLRADNDLPSRCWPPWQGACSISSTRSSS